MHVRAATGLASRNLRLPPPPFPLGTHAVTSCCRCSLPPASPSDKHQHNKRSVATAARLPLIESKLMAPWLLPPASKGGEASSDNGTTGRPPRNDRRAMQTGTQAGPIRQRHEWGSTNRSMRWGASSSSCPSIASNGISRSITQSGRSGGSSARCMPALVAHLVTNSKTNMRKELVKSSSDAGRQLLITATQHSAHWQHERSTRAPAFCRHPAPHPHRPTPALSETHHQLRDSCTVHEAP